MASSAASSANVTPRLSVHSGAADLMEKAKEHHEELLADGAVKTNECNLAGDEMKFIVERCEKGDKAKDEAKEKVNQAFGIDVDSMRQLASRNRNRNLCQLMFCFVIMGCELDLIGFFGAFQGYWALDIPLVKGLLVAMPSSYMVCIFLYFWCIQPGEMQDNKKGNEDANTGNRLQRQAKALLRRKNVRLSLYHFLPLARYILLIKSTTGEDVEGVFRVNSLSSFTLGSCQIVALIFTITTNGNSISGLSIFVYMNMFSQLVNWSITILYFATGVADGMKKSIASGAYSANLSSQMRKTLVQLQVSISEDAQRLASEDASVMDDNQSTSSGDEDGYLSVMRRTLENEIMFFKKTAVDLRYFDPIELLTIRRAVYMQFSEEFDR